MSIKKKTKDMELIGEAIENIRSDREQAQLLLTKTLQYILNNEERHKEVGFIAAKYLEVLQRSNEQLVKLTSIIKKEESLELSEKDKEDIFDIMNSTEEE